MSYVIVYAKYRPEVGPWTNLFYVGTDYSPTNWGDYYLWWTYLQGYVQMQVAVKAYNSGGVLIGSDYSYVTLPTGGGGGGGVPI